MSEKFLSKIVIENIGPFKYAEIKLRPLTIFLGRNTSGKSFIMKLLWTLGITTPNLDYLSKQIYEDVKALLEKRDNKSFKQVLVKAIQEFPNSWKEPLKKNLLYCFEIHELSDLLRDKSKVGRIEIVTKEATLKIEILEKEFSDINVEWLEMPRDYIYESFNLRLIDEGELIFIDKHIGREFSIAFRNIEELAEGIVSEILPLIIASTIPPVAAHPDGMAYLVDGRSGILRSSGVTTIPELEYVKWIRKIYDNKHLIDIEVAKRTLLKELGCDDIKFDFVVNYPMIKLITWNGREIELSKAPSGIRECLLPCLLLLSKFSTKSPVVIYFEEPEAHLHPKAIKELVKVIAYVIGNVEKYRRIVMISTHNPDMIYLFNNLILLGNLPPNEKDIIADQRGYKVNDKVIELRYDCVSVYLFERNEIEKEVIVKEIPVSPEGIDEEYFVKIAEELLDERSSIIERLQVT